MILWCVNMGDVIRTIMKTNHHLRFLSNRIRRNRWFEQELTESHNSLGVDSNVLRFSRSHAERVPPTTTWLRPTWCRNNVFCRKQWSVRCVDVLGIVSSKWPWSTRWCSNAGQESAHNSGAPAGVRRSRGGRDAPTDRLERTDGPSVRESPRRTIGSDVATTKTTWTVRLTSDVTEDSWLGRPRPSRFSSPTWRTRLTAFSTLRLLSNRRRQMSCRWNPSTRIRICEFITNVNNGLQAWILHIKCTTGCSYWHTWLFTVARLLPIIIGLRTVLDALHQLSARTTRTQQFYYENPNVQAGVGVTWKVSCPHLTRISTTWG